MRGTEVIITMYTRDLFSGVVVEDVAGHEVVLLNGKI